MEPIISPALVALDIDCKEKADVIKALSLQLEKDKRVSSKEDFLKAVLEREREYSTAVGFEFAIPHAKTAWALTTSIAFAKLNHPVAWEDNEMVRYVLLLAVPQADAGEVHLKLIARLAQKLLSEEFRKELITKQSCEAVAELIRQI